MLQSTQSMIPCGTWHCRRLYRKLSRRWDEKIGRLGLQVLAGEKPETLPPKPAESAANYVDWRQLQRWGLDKSGLPSDSVVRFRAPSLWETYKWQIATAIALIIGQAILISALLWQAQRRRRAELKARDSEERMNLATTSANLGLWHWDSASNRVWASETAGGSWGWAQRPSCCSRHCLATWLHRQDLVAVATSAEQPARDGEPDKREHRLLRPDGSERWVRSISHIKLDAAGKPTQMTGVSPRCHRGKSGRTEIDQHAPGTDASYPGRHTG